MRIFTLLFFFSILFLNASLLAKPTTPTYSEPSDTLLLVEDLEPKSIPSSKHLKPTPEAKESVAPMFLVINDFCGNGTGEIRMTPDPNTPGPWLHMWSNGETTATITGLTPGVYTVTVVDANGNFQIGTAIVGEFPPVSPISVTANIVGSSLCDGTSNGAIDITVNPTPSDWTYAWSSGEMTEDISGVPPGTYTVSVTFGVTCTSTYTFVVPNLTTAPILSPPIGGFGLDFCDTGNGTAAVFAQGGTPPYTYEWSNGDTDLAIDNLVAGEYTVTVTGADGCTSTLMGTVAPATLAVNVDDNVITPNTTCNGANGSITITVTPPGLWLPSAMYEWSNGATTQNISNLSSGSYVVTVTRLGTCTDSHTVFIEDEPIIPTLSIVNTAASCGLSNGAVNLTPLAGGVPPFTYVWSNGETTQDLANVPPGPYEVTLTGGNMCTVVGTTEVDDNQAVFSYTATVLDNTSCDTINGRISLSLFPPTLSYQWSNGATGTNLTSLAPGDYTVTISAGGTCTTEETFNVGSIVEYPALPATVDTATCNLSNGSIDLVVNGGLAPFTYLWSNGATTQDLVNLQADTFYVTVTSAVGCSNERMVIVPNVNDTISIAAGVLDNISCTTPTGFIGLNVMPLDTSYTFLWSNGATTDTLLDLSGGTYLVTVTLGGSCIALDTFTIVDDALPPDLSSVASAANCGFDNGFADITVLNGAAPYTYLWSNAAVTEDLQDLVPGTYTVTVTGANNCSAVTTVNVLNNDIPLGVSGTPAANTSCTAANGALDINVTPAGTYDYLWSNAAVTEDLSNLAAGIYTVTVTFGTCVGSNSFSVVDNALAPNLTTSNVAASCDFSNGSADLSVSNGVGPFTFLWSNTEVTEDLTNLAAGTYTVTVTGANGCTEETSLTVANNNIALNLSGNAVENTSCVAFNGTLDLSVAPAGTYTYLWSNTEVTEDLANLAAGTYTVTVSLGSCESISTFVVADNTETPNLTTDITASICGVDNGAIDLSVGGPAGPYTYLWSNASVDEDLVNLLPGNYTVTVTASNGCTEVAAINVPNNASNFSLAGASTPLTNCAADNGAIDLNITPAGTYTYEWSTGATDEDLSNLPPGTYTVSVTESGSCTATASYFVIDQRTNPVTAQSLTPELCGLADGSIDLSVNGGTAPYSFLWSNTEVTEDISNLSAGVYSVVVTDANNCTAIASATIPGNSINFSLVGASTPNTSCVQNDGTINLNLNPPTGYTFLWSNLEVTEDLAGLGAGTYTVTVSAGGNCTSTAAFNVTSDVPVPLLSQNIVAAECGAADGSIDLSISGSSPAPYNFVWSNGALVEDLNGVLSGNYDVTVTAANGCTSTQSFNVPENVFSPNIASSLTQATSCVLDNGAINLSVTPTGTYTYVWSNGEFTEDLANVGAGTYTVTVSAGGACTSTAVLMVTSNVPSPSLTENIISAFCGQADGSIDLSVSGSPTPHTFAWSNGVMLEDLNGVQAGDYSVTVTSSNGCTSTETFTIPDNSITLAIGSSLTPATSCVTDNGAIDLSITPAGNYTYTWSSGQATEDLANVAAGSYTVTVSAGGNCSSTAELTVSSNVPAPVLANNILAANCGQPSGSIDLSVSGSPTPYNFVWSNGALVEDLNAVLAGNYTVTVTAANGCTSVESFVIPDDVIVPVIAGAATASDACGMPNGAIDLTVTAAASYTVLWSNGSVTEDLSDLPAGSYTVTVSAGGGTCTGTASFNIQDQSTQPQANIASNNTALDCSLTSITLNGTAAGTPNPTTFVWSSNGNVLGNGTTLPVTAPGNYELLIVDDVTACTGTATITVTQNLDLPQLAVTNPALLTCTNPSQTLSGSSTTGGVQLAWASIIGTDTTILGNGSSLPVNAAGTYFLLGFNPANNCANAVSVNVQLDQNPPTADAGQPFTLDCAGETAPLTGSGTGAPNLSFQWTSQDGNFVSGTNTATPLINEAGTYVLTVTNPANGCTETDEVVILPEVPVAFASVVQPTCTNLVGSIRIDSVAGLSDPILYGLNNGPLSAQNQFINVQPGTYTIAVEGGNGCAATAIVTVDAAATVQILMETEAEISLGNTYQIDAQVNIPNAEIETVRWTPAIGLECDTCLSTLASPSGTTRYNLLVISDAGCEARSTLVLTVDKTRKVYGPNIFSPNGDGNNELFTIFADPASVTRIRSLQVYSRWGEAVYERLDFAPDDVNVGWDGTFKGQKMNPAVFVWQAVIEFVDGQEEVFTGDVTLQR
jgi:gliding motility-associated-like protein